MASWKAEAGRQQIAAFEPKAFVYRLVLCLSGDWPGLNADGPNT
jgi:hypothetical protein